MITQVHIKNFKAIRDASVDLTPIHLLIGPNDSGSTIQRSYVRTFDPRDCTTTHYVTCILLSLQSRTST